MIIIIILKDIFFDITTLLIAIISLIISILVFYNNRKNLHVDFSNTVTPVRNGDIKFLLEKNGSKTDYSYGDSLLIKVEIVNHSPKDIAFFDLECFETTSNERVSILTRHTMFAEIREQIALANLKKYSTPIELNIPERDYGVFKSGTFIRFHLILFPKKDFEKINLSFKIAKKSIIKSIFRPGVNRNNFKTYKNTCHIKSWTDRLND